MTAALSPSPVATAHNDSALKPISFVTTRAVPYGSTLICALGTSGTAAAPTWSVSAAGGLTWQQDATRFNANVLSTVIFSAPVTLPGGVPAGTTLTFTVGASDTAFGRVAGGIYEATGLLQAAYTDRTASANNNNVSPSVVDTVATAQADELVIAAFAYASVPIFTPNTGAGYSATTPVVTTAATTNKQVVVAYKTTTATGVQTAGGTFDTGNPWVGAMVTYKGGVAPPPPTPPQAVVAGAVATGTVGAGASTLLLTTTRAVPAGSTLLLGLSTSIAATASSFTVSDLRGAVWQRDAYLEATGGTSLIAALYSAPLLAPLASGSVITVTCNNFIGRWSAVVMEATGTQQAAGYVDKTAVAPGNNAAPSVATAATTQADELVVAVFALPSAPVFTPGAGYTLDPGAVTTGTSANKQVVMEHKLVTATGVQTANGTLDAASTWVGVVATYKAGAAGQMFTGHTVLRSGRLVIVPLGKTLRSGVMR